MVEEKDLEKKEEEIKQKEVVENTTPTDKKGEVDAVLEESVEHLNEPEQIEGDLKNKISEVVQKLNQKYFDGENKITEEHVLEQYRSFNEFQQPLGGKRVTHEFSQKMERDDVARDIIVAAAKIALSEFKEELEEAENEEERQKIQSKIDDLTSKGHIDLNVIYSEDYDFERKK